eukprot:TRINITY_DN66601_c9_g3_i2.p1 TRINITY_DN66601_c9_g3~~TRINITY_DN66601_c9_g3_i2.p1  ORF type:complete len:385 (-),score=174.86 TRINITY_DN66601_c9_g3_i2:39-1193(-)
MQRLQPRRRHRWTPTRIGPCRWARRWRRRRRCLPGSRVLAGANQTTPRFSSSNSNSNSGSKDVVAPGFKGRDPNKYRATADEPSEGEDHFKPKYGVPCDFHKVSAEELRAEIDFCFRAAIMATPSGLQHHLAYADYLRFHLKEYGKAEELYEQLAYHSKVLADERYPDGVLKRKMNGLFANAWMHQQFQKYSWTRNRVLSAGECDESNVDEHPEVVAMRERCDKAAEWSKKAFPTDGSVWHSIAMYQWKRLGDCDAAVKTFDEMMLLRPLYKQALKDYAALCGQMRNQKQQYQLLNEAKKRGVKPLPFARFACNGRCCRAMRGRSGKLCCCDKKTIRAIVNRNGTPWTLMLHRDPVMSSVVDREYAIVCRVMAAGEVYERDDTQ